MKNGNPSLNFLKNKNVIYYAGLDEKGLPFHESARKILGLSIKNITYLKALSLVADHVVVPPTFFFFCIPAEEGRVYHKQLLPLFSERHVLTTVYGGLNKTRDFLALKKEKGFEDEIALISLKEEILSSFFDGIPLIQRNVGLQSESFKRRFVTGIQNIPDSKCNHRDKQLVLNSLEKREKIEDVALSRETIISLNNSLLWKGKIEKRTYRSIYYAMNASYYEQGAATYFSNISCLSSARYSILGEQLFRKESGRILVGYDPELIMSIFRAHGISEEHIDAMTIRDIDSIKKTRVFANFCERYRVFVESLQECIIAAERVSESQLKRLFQIILEKFQHEYLKGQAVVNRQKSYWGLGENITFSAITGAIGFFLIPLYGALLGTVPVILQAARITPRLSDYFIDRIAASEKAFCAYIEILRSVAATVKAEGD